MDYDDFFENERTGLPATVEKSFGIVMSLAPESVEDLADEATAVAAEHLKQERSVNSGVYSLRKAISDEVAELAIQLPTLSNDSVIVETERLRLLGNLLDAAKRATGLAGYTEIPVTASNDDRPADEAPGCRAAPQRADSEVPREE